MSNNLLVTGGAGFVGQNLIHYLLGQPDPPRIVALDALTYAANPTSLEAHVDSGRINFCHGDIADFQLVGSLFAEHHFDGVVHLAAESHVDRSVLGPDAFVQTNVVGTHNLLKCALIEWSERDNLDHARFLHISTDEVFGDLGADDPAFTEQSRYRPSSPYSATKAAADHLARAYNRTFRLPVIVTNCSNNYGPYQHPEKLIPLMIINALEGKPLPVYGDGANIRDWLFVVDHCRALALALKHGVPGHSYNVGGGVQKTNLEVVRTICALLDAEFDKDQTLAKSFPNSPAASGKDFSTLITFVRDRPGHDRRYAVDTTFSKQALGYHPIQTFKTGLADTVTWYVRNEAWWRRAVARGFQDWKAVNYDRRDEIMAQIPK